MREGWQRLAAAQAAARHFQGVLLPLSQRIVDETHVIVNGINTVKKHAKPNPMKNQPGGIITKEMPIDVSNVAIYNPVTKKPDRIGVRTLEDGRKVRFYKGNGEQIV